MIFSARNIILPSLCVSLLFAVACHNAKTELSPEMKAALNNKTTQTRTTMPDRDHSNETRAEKEVRLATEKNISLMIKVLAQSDRIFEQIWPHIWDNSTRVNNVFRVSKNYLNAKYADDGAPLNIQMGNACVEGDAVLQGLQNSPLAIKKDETMTDEEFKELSRLSVPTAFEVAVRNCQTRKADRLFAWNSDQKGSFNINFVTNNFPQGTGLSLKTLGKPVNCLAKADVDNSRLNYLRCTGLGQNNTTQAYVEISLLEFSRDAQMMVHVVGTKYKDLSTVDSKIDITVPLQGEILVVEEMTGTDNTILEQNEQALTPKTPPVSDVQKGEAQNVATEGAEKPQTEGAEQAPAAQKVDLNNLTPEQEEALKQGIPLDQLHEIQAQPENEGEEVDPAGEAGAESLNAGQESGQAEHGQPVAAEEQSQEQPDQEQPDQQEVPKATLPDANEPYYRRQADDNHVMPQF